MNKDRILELLSDTLEKDIGMLRRLDENAPLYEIGFSSIQLVQFIVDIETDFGIEINDSDLLMRHFETIAAMFATLSKYFGPPAELKKVLVLDCDGVLWKGVAGEEETAVGEDYLLFQDELVKLYERGVLLCLCSKNERRNIEEAFGAPEMRLKWEHISRAKINMNSKAENIKEIANELNLSADSFVFTDDSDYELGLINALLPEIETVKADFSELGYIKVIGEIKAFFESAPAQDLNRTRLYREQKEREKEKRLFSTAEQYNNSLETKCVCIPAAAESAGRIAELSQRTNQFNLSCARYSEDEIRRMIAAEEYTVMALSASDKYGDMGLVGAAAVKMTKESAVIESFMLSCRVFGRGFEDVLLGEIKAISDTRALSGVYVQAEKNARFADFYPQNGVTIHGQF